MYIPAFNRISDSHAINEFIHANGFATMVTSGKDGLWASHLPFLLDEAEDGGRLRCHMARANEQWRHFDSNPAVLCMFLGPHAYVSPSWYPSKQETGKVVPTWNYLTVHAHGRITAIEDAGWLRAHVGALTKEHESERPEPWAVEDAPPDYIAGLLRAIVGFELVITRLEGKWKLSQNRPAADIAGVREGLARDGDPLAQWMGDPRP